MQAIAEAGSLLMRYFDRQIKIEYKGDANLVTVADRKSEVEPGPAVTEQHRAALVAAEQFVERQLAGLHGLHQTLKLGQRGLVHWPARHSRLRHGWKVRPFSFTETSIVVSAPPAFTGLPANIRSHI